MWPEWLPLQPPPTTTFNEVPISTKEFKCRSPPSSPWDQKYSQLSAVLIDLYSSCWSLASTWRRGTAYMKLIPKSSAEENHSIFQSIEVTYYVTPKVGVCQGDPPLHIHLQHNDVQPDWSLQSNQSITTPGRLSTIPVLYVSSPPYWPYVITGYHKLTSSWIS